MDPDAFSDIQVHVRFDVQQRRIYASIDAHATAHLICDRTLVPYNESISGQFDILFTYDKLGPEAEQEHEEIRLLSPSDTQLDLTNIVHDTLLLALPLRRVAPHAENLNLPLQYGLPDHPPQETDPRWAALRKLRSDASDL